MAFASGTETVEVSRKLYVGVAPVYVLAVNPSKNKLDEIYGRESKEDPNYIGTTEVNGTTMSQVRIDFIVKTDSSKCDGIELINKIHHRKNWTWMSKDYKFEIPIDNVKLTLNDNQVHQVCDVKPHVFL